MEADCSTPARQPQEAHDHRGWTDELTAPATWVSRQSVDGAVDLTHGVDYWLRFEGLGGVSIALSQLMRHTGVRRPSLFLGLKPAVS